MRCETGPLTVGERRHEVIYKSIRLVITPKRILESDEDRPRSFVNYESLRNTVVVMKCMNVSCAVV